ncbi:MAG: type II toxin-antitoxin system YafQ family toxin [Chloroflexi bacterium]|nr:type II toxin-antitoxin system YafQ family toxin [Chloroflexota bacterium]
MREVVYTTQVKKGLKLYRKRGVSLAPFFEVIEKLERGEVLDPKFKDHQTQGTRHKERDCHIAPDWVLIYAVDGDTLYLLGTGPNQVVCPSSVPMVRNTIFMH